jgi:hypothetical protein
MSRSPNPKSAGHSPVHTTLLVAINILEHGGLWTPGSIINGGLDEAVEGWTSTNLTICLRSSPVGAHLLHQAVGIIHAIDILHVIEHIGGKLVQTQTLLEDRARDAR